MVGAAIEADAGNELLARLLRILEPRDVLMRLVVHSEVPLLLGGTECEGSVSVSDNGIHALRVKPRVGKPRHHEIPWPEILDAHLLIFHHQPDTYRL
jgi:hypothetical protein